MFIPLGIKTDYSLYKSLIKIDDLILYAKNNNLDTIGILDNNLCSSYTFIINSLKNNIKPIVGLDLEIDNYRIFLYPNNYNGLSNLFKLTKYILDNNIEFIDLKKFNKDVMIVLPYESFCLYDVALKIFDEVFLAFSSEDTKLAAKVITDNIVYINDIYCLKDDEAKYINYLKLIEDNKKLGDITFNDYSSNVIKSFNYDNSILTNKIDLKFENDKRYIPTFNNELNDSFRYLKDLAYRGLKKRFNNNIKDEYVKRLDYELSVIKKMGFEDYFLIVFDYVRYAIKNGIFVGAGRGSAVGSLVSYSLGITNIDPLEYNLLFERFLNPERITMPDIDIDFLDERIDEVIDYVKNKYGEDKVCHIIAYGTMTAKEVLRTVGKINNVNEVSLNNLLKQIDSKKSLQENEGNVKKILEHDNILNKVYKESYFLEGIKHHISTHAAGIVISSVNLDELVPIIKSGNEYLIGFQKDELEPLGLIKMDFLSVKNLTILSHTLTDLKQRGIDININKIPLDDKLVYDLFKAGDTVGIFQFETTGMKNFLKKAKPNNFSDLVMIQAMFRPGPMQSIDEFLKRKNEGKKIDYLHPLLEPILKDTYGILIYQEQIMEILRVVGNYSYADADIIRRAISKKKLDVITSSKDKFKSEALKNNVSSDVIDKIFSLIMDFAEFGFNKSHSVAYSFIAYQMAYLKVHYPEVYYINLLNYNHGDEVKIKEYINSLKKNGIKIIKPDINKSLSDYVLDGKSILLPIRVIKGIGGNIQSEILNNRTTPYLDFFDFVSRVKINKNNLITLIDAGVLDSFNYNHSTLKANIDAALTYKDLISEIDSSLVNKPEMVINEYDDKSVQTEVELYGFYITDHPSSKYPDCFKLIDIIKNFNKTVTSVVLVEKISKIKTKNNKDMAFITASDDTDTCEFVYFDYDDTLNVKDLIEVVGHIERRYDKYQIVIKKVKKI